MYSPSGYDINTAWMLWSFGGAVLLCFLLLDFDWKRRLFETYQEKMKRPAFRDKEIAKTKKFREAVQYLMDNHPNNK
jgi:hypothetical protein